MTSIANFTIKYELILSMMDGKVCNSLTNNIATQKCFICGALPINMNDIENVQRSVKKKILSFGISSLHARIKFYECLLHVAYRLELKKWQVRSNESKALASRKRSIQDKFQLGKFLNNTIVFTFITGIKEEIIYRFGIILESRVIAQSMSTVFTNIVWKP